MTDHQDDDWRTVNVTPLAPGIVATVRHAYGSTSTTWQRPAVALLHRERAGVEQIVLGVLNESGEVQACYSECSDYSGLDLVHLGYGPFMTPVAALHHTSDRTQRLTNNVGPQHDSRS